MAYMTYFGDVRNKLLTIKGPLKNTFLWAYFLANTEKV